MKNFLVKDIMIKNPIFADPDDTLEDAAVEMKNVGCGVLPVGNKSSIRGTITDRDIVIRALAAGKDATKERVKDHMTAKALFCKESDTIKEAAETMKKNKVSRLIVKNDSNKISGILSFSCILRGAANAEEIADALINASSQIKEFA